MPVRRACAVGTMYRLPIRNQVTMNVHPVPLESPVTTDNSISSYKSSGTTVYTGST